MFLKNKITCRNTGYDPYFPFCELREGRRRLDAQRVGGLLPIPRAQAGRTDAMEAGHPQEAPGLHGWSMCAKGPCLELENFRLTRRVAESGLEKLDSIRGARWRTPNPECRRDVWIVPFVSACGEAVRDPATDLNLRPEPPPNGRRDIACPGIAGAAVLPCNPVGVRDACMPLLQRVYVNLNKFELRAQWFCVADRHTDWLRCCPLHDVNTLMLCLT